MTYRHTSAFNTTPYPLSSRFHESLSFRKRTDVCQPMDRSILHPKEVCGLYYGSGRNGEREIARPRRRDYSPCTVTASERGANLFDSFVPVACQVSLFRGSIMAEIVPEGCSTKRSKSMENLRKLSSVVFFLGTSLFEISEDGKVRNVEFGRCL